MDMSKAIREGRDRLGMSQEALAERLDIRFADAGNWDISLAYDGVHFTEQGHKAFATGLLEELK